MTLLAPIPVCHDRAVGGVEMGRTVNRPYTLAVVLDYPPHALAGNYLTKDRPNISGVQ